MGCFVSTKRKQHDAEVSQPPTKPPSERSIIAPSHASEELETVKQVLSETPKRNPIATKSQPQKPNPNKTLHNFKEGEEQDDESKEDEKKALLMVTREEVTPQVSEEVCSKMSDTTTEQREIQDSQETRKRVNGSPTKPRKNRSFSGGDHGSRREKKLHASRSIGAGSQRRDQVLPHQRMLVNGGTRVQPRRRDPGETSFRCADDGVAGRSVVGRCPSARRTNGPSRTTVPEKGCRKMEVPVREGKCNYGSNNETLENPLVSLECFIFI